MKAVNRENYVPNLGQPCGDDARRDAVHTMSMSPRAVGVLDPFRKDCIKAGSRVWGLLYPGTITGLRHVWSHSAFAIKTPEPQ